MTVTSCPAPRAASRTRKGNRPFPAMSPNFTDGPSRRREDKITTESSMTCGQEIVVVAACLLVRDDFFRPPRRAPQDDAALRRADEVHEVLDLGARERPVLLDLLQREQDRSLACAEVQNLEDFIRTSQ